MTAGTSPVAAGTSRAVIGCVACGAQFKVERKFLSRTAKCTRCGERFTAVEVKGDEPSLTGMHADAASKQDARLGATVGQFRIVGVLGRGGMGTVYEAVDTVLDRRVAIKMLPPALVAQGREVIDRFLTEARSAARLEHPNIVGIYQVGNDGQVPYIAMQLVRGGSAADYVRERGPMSPQDATHIVAQAAKALQAAHDAGVVHRDIKPANIMLGEGKPGEPPVVKVADFGLAKIEGAGDLTMDGGVLGTPSYMAPESCRGEAADGRSDIYSLGVTYFALLLGHPPYGGDNARAIMYKHIYDPLPDPRTKRPEIPEGCVRALMRAMEKDRTRRYQRADEFVADLMAIDFTGGRAAEASLGEGMIDWAALQAAQQRNLAEGVFAGPGNFSGNFSATQTVAGMTQVAGRVRTGGGTLWPLWVGAAAAGIVGAVLAVKLAGGGGKPETKPAKDDVAVKPKPGIKDDGDAPDPVPPPPTKKPGGVEPVPPLKVVEPPPALAAEVAASWNRVSAGLRSEVARIGPPEKFFELLAEARALAKRCREETFPKIRKVGDDAAKLVDDTTAGMRRVLGYTGNVAVTSLSVSPDGRMVAVGGRNGGVWLWTLGGVGIGPAPQRNWAAHMAQVTVVAWSPDSKRLLSAGSDGTMKVWTVAGGVPPVLFKMPPTDPDADDPSTPEVTHAGFHDGGTAVVAAGSDGSLRTFKLPGGEVVPEASAAGIKSTALALSPVGRNAAAAFLGGRVVLGEVGKSAGVFQLDGHKATVRRLQFNRDGGRLLAVDTEGTVSVWDLVASPPKYVGLWGAGLGGITASAIRADDRIIALAGTSSDDIVLMDGNGGRQIGAYLAAAKPVVPRPVGKGAVTPLNPAGAVDGIRAMDFTPDGTRLMAGGADGAVLAWVVPAPSVPPSALTPVMPPDPRPDPRPVARGPATPAPFPVIDTAGGPIQVVESVAGGHLLVKPMRGPMVLASASEGTITAELLPAPRIGEQILHAVSPDGTRIAAVAQPVGDKGGRLTVFGSSDGTALDNVTPHDGPVRQVAWSPDGALLATLGGDADGVVELKLWDRSLRLPKARIAGSINGVTSFRFSADGRFVLTVGGGRGNVPELRVWQTSDGKERTPAPDKLGRSMAPPAFDPEARTAVYLGGDGLLHAWDVEDRKETARVPAGVEGATAPTLQWSPDGRWGALLLRGTPGAGANPGTPSRVTLWQSRPLLEAFTANLGTGFGVNTATFSPDGRMLGVVDYERDPAATGTAAFRPVARLRCWDTTALRERPGCKERFSYITTVVFSRDGALAAIVGAPVAPADAPPVKGGGMPGLRMQVTVIETATGKVRAHLRDGAHALMSATFDADGKRVAAGSMDGRVAVFAIPDPVAPETPSGEGNTGPDPKTPDPKAGTPKTPDMKAPETKIRPFAPTAG